jgi:hypothetical protein
VSLQVGEDETIERPIAVPNAMRITDIAEATNAPATTLVKRKNGVAASTGTLAVRCMVSMFDP